MVWTRSLESLADADFFVLFAGILRVAAGAADPALAGGAVWADVSAGAGGLPALGKPRCFRQVRTAVGLGGFTVVAPRADTVAVPCCWHFFRATKRGSVLASC